MTTMLPINQPIISSEQSRLNYRTIGFRDAGNVKADIDAYEVSLDRLYSRYISKKSYKKSQQSEKNFEIESSIKECTDKIDFYKKELKRLNEDELVKAEKEKEKALDEYLDFKGNPQKYIHQEKDKLNTWIWGLLSLFIAIFLYFFYSSVLYSAVFMQIKADSMDTISYYIFYPYTFEEAMRMGFSTVMMVTFAPFIFGAIGLATHSIKNKYLTVLFVLFAFVADALLAYHISEKIYEAKAINIYSQVEKFNLMKALFDGNFWLIILLGFGVYMLFGFVFSKYRELVSTSMKINQKENELKEKINLSEKRIFDIKNRIEQLNNLIAENHTRAISTRKEPERIYFSVSEIVRILSDYTFGWQHYLKQGNYSDDLIREINIRYNNFLVKKGLIDNEK
ncbi:MAG: hypothetical protein N2043_03200 [Ignavibacterium sp.]|nr:hypothetical protein [Ignavibacterium sp.]